MISFLTATYPKQNHETFQFNFFPGQSRHHRAAGGVIRGWPTQQSLLFNRMLIQVMNVESTRLQGRRKLGGGLGSIAPKTISLVTLILINFLLIFWPATGSEENISWLLQTHFCLLNQNSRTFYFSKVTILRIKACVLIIFFFSLRPKSKFWIFSLRKGRKETGTEMARVLVLPCYVQVGIHNKRQQNSGRNFGQNFDWNSSGPPCSKVKMKGRK